MKYIYTLILFFLVGNVGYSQCIQEVDNITYTQNYSTIAVQGNDQLKLDQAIAFTGNNCVNSNQVKAIAMLFNSEAYRFDFCALSYQNVVDKSEFYEVYDAFQSYSYVFRLHDFVREQNEFVAENENTTQPDVNIEETITYPGYAYPNYNGYAGVKGCSAPIPDGDFNVFAKKVNGYSSDTEKMIAASVIVQDNCHSMAQFMKLASLFTLETNRKSFMIKNFQYVYDLENYESAKQCLTHVPYQTEWMEYCLAYLKPAEPALTCDVDEKLFNEMLKRIETENFADDQLNVVKMLNNESCFSTAQVKRIMDVFSFPENKLDVAEILYAKCTDRKNYYQLKGSFSFPSYEADFQDLINGN